MGPDALKLPLVVQGKIFFNTSHPSCCEILHLYTFNSASSIKKESKGLKKISVNLKKRRLQQKILGDQKLEKDSPETAAF